MNLGVNNLILALTILILWGCQGPESSSLKQETGSPGFTKAELSIVTIERGDQLAVRGFATDSDYPRAYYYLAEPLGEDSYILRDTDCTVPDSVVYVFECWVTGGDHLVVSVQPLVEGVATFIESADQSPFPMFRFDPGAASTGIVPLVSSHP